LIWNSFEMTHRKYVTSIAEVPFANIHLLRNFTLLEKPFQVAQVFLHRQTGMKFLKGPKYN
jgi:hypothetical protein